MVILRVMATHQQSPGVLASAMDAVTKFIAHDTANADVLGSLCVKLVFDVIHVHEGNEAVVSTGLHALAMMAKSSSERKSCMHELGAIQSTLLITHDAQTSRKLAGTRWCLPFLCERD
jgi:hypothetical protein